MVYTSKIAYKHAAFIFDERGHIVSKGFNYQKDYYSPIFSIHAEVDAINNIKYNKYHKNKLHNYTILVVRLGTINYISENITQINLAESAPCANCYSYMKQHNFKDKNIYHSTMIIE